MLSMWSVCWVFVGARLQRVELNRDMLIDVEAALLRSLDREESTDVARAVIDLSSKRQAYEAALRVTASTFDLSLLNFV